MDAFYRTYIANKVVKSSLTSNTTWFEKSKVAQNAHVNRDYYAVTIIDVRISSSLINSYFMM